MWELMLIYSSIFALWGKGGRHEKCNENEQGEICCHSYGPLAPCYTAAAHHDVRPRAGRQREGRNPRCGFRECPSAQSGLFGEWGQEGSSVVMSAPMRSTAAVLPWVL